MPRGLVRDRNVIDRMRKSSSVVAASWASRSVPRIESSSVIAALGLIRDIRSSIGSTLYTYRKAGGDRKACRSRLTRRVGHVVCGSVEVLAEPFSLNRLFKKKSD